MFKLNDFYPSLCSSASNYSSNIDEKTFIKVFLILFFGGEGMSLKALVFMGVRKSLVILLSTLSRIKVFCDC